VGLYKLNPVYPQLESNWFQTLGAYEVSENLVSELCFQMQLLPLHSGINQWVYNPEGCSEAVAFQAGAYNRPVHKPQLKLFYLLLPLKQPR
jgi:hypothetical protein